MAESLPGTMSIFAEALATLTGSGLTGQAAIEELYRATEAGEVVSAEILPIVAQIMSERAQPKLGIMKRSSIAESARVVNAWNNLLERFSKSGGEEGFAGFFRTIADELPRLTPLVEGFGAAFLRVSNILGPVVRTFADYVQIMASVKRSMDEVDPAISKISAGLLLLTTRLGRIMLPLTSFFLLMEDIAVGVMGGVSVSGYLFNFLDKFVAYDKKILGLTMAVLSLVAAFGLLRKLGSFGLPGGGNKSGKPGGGLGKTLLGGGLLAWAARSLLSNPYVIIGSGLGYLGYNTDAFQSAVASQPDRWLNMLAYQGANVTGWKAQREYWNAFFASRKEGVLSGRDIERHFLATQRGTDWLNRYLEGETKTNPDGTRTRWMPSERQEALEDLARRINEAYSQSRMIRASDYEGPLLDKGVNASLLNGQNNPSDYVNNLNARSPDNIIVNNEVNLNADGVLDPEGVRGAIEGLIPELEEATRGMLQEIFSTTQDAYGG